MSSMRLIAYNPPPKTPPLVWVHDGSTYVLNPPDMYWRQVEEEYVIGDIIHPQSGRVLRQKVAKRKVYQPDPNLTAQMRVRPSNQMWISKSALSEVMQAKYAEFNQYIEDVTDHQERARAKLQDLQKKFEENVADLQKGYEHRIESMRKAYDIEEKLAEARKHDEVMVRAAELGMSFDDFKAAVDKAAEEIRAKENKLTKATEKLTKNSGG